jgi:hypothetical protein
MIVSKNVYLSKKVAYLSEIASYNRINSVTSYFYPWWNISFEEELYEFVLENNDNLILENYDSLAVILPR